MSFLQGGGGCVSRSTRCNGESQLLAPTARPDPNHAGIAQLQGIEIAVPAHDRRGVDGRTWNLGSEVAVDTLLLEDGSQAYARLAVV